MGKDDQIIMAVEREILFGSCGENHFQGFRPSDEFDYERLVLMNFKWKRRGDMEVDPTFKQPIAYAIVVNPSLRKVFAYKRASQASGQYDEDRLSGNWSWGFGGHIQKEDIESGGNPIHESMLRELIREEVRIYGNVRPRVLGYINDDTPEQTGKIAVGQVHFGILYLVESDASRVEPLDREIALVDGKSFSELESICSSPQAKVDSWSRIALEPLRKLLI